MATQQNKWTKVPLKTVLDYEQPNKYIITTPINTDDNLIPVLTANKSFIKGYTSETKDICTNLPVIIFDDFTADNKYVNFPFKVKSSAMKLLRINNSNTSLKFIYYQMQLRNVNTTTHKRYYLSIYQNQQFSFPINTDNQIDIKKQQQVVDEIEKQFTKLDAVVDDLKKIKIKLEVYKKSVLENIFTGKLIRVSEWEITTLNNFGEIFTGTTPSTKKREYYGTDICFFRPKDLDAGLNLNKSEIMLSKEGARKARLLPSQSVLVTCIGATIGKTGITTIEGATNQQINSIVPNLEKYIPELIYYFIISEKMQRNIIDNSSSTTLPILNKRKFMGLKIKFPKRKEEQRKILDIIESKFSVIDKLEETTNNALEKVELLRKSILKDAFNGELIK